MGYVFYIQRMGPGWDTAKSIAWEEWMSVVDSDSTLRRSSTERLEVLCRVPDQEMEVVFLFMPDSWDVPELRDLPPMPSRIGFNAMYFFSIQPIVVGIAKKLRANIIGESGELYYTFQNDSLINGLSGGDPK